MSCSKNTAIAAPVVNVSDFLRELVQVLPGTVHAHASILLPHLSSRPYQIRNAVVYSLGEVITAAHGERKATEQEERPGSGGVCAGGTESTGVAGEVSSFLIVRFLGVSLALSSTVRCNDDDFVLEYLFVAVIFTCLFWRHGVCHVSNAFSGFLRTKI